MSSGDAKPDELRAFTIAPAISRVRIAARSNVGRIDFQTTGVAGSVHAAMADGMVNLEPAPRASLVVPVMSLTSGNALYDNELQQRLQVQRYPNIRAELDSTTQLPGGRLMIAGALTISGARRDLTGTAQLTMVTESRLIVEGEQPIDMRDFGIKLPSTLMMRIYPDVIVRYWLDATA